MGGFCERVGGLCILLNNGAALKSKRLRTRVLAHCFTIAKLFLSGCQCVAKVFWVFSIPFLCYVWVIAKVYLFFSLFLCCCQVFLGGCQYVAKVFRMYFTYCFAIISEWLLLYSVCIYPIGVLLLN